MKKRFLPVCLALLMIPVGAGLAGASFNMSAFARQWLSQGCSPDYWCADADIDHSTAVDYADFAAFAADGTRYYVQNAGQIADAMDTAGPGDTLVMANGTWTDEQIVFTGSGTDIQPITLCAETPGQVVLTGQSSVWIGGNNLVVDGLLFTNGYLNNNNGVIRFRSSANDCRATNCAIVDFSRPDTTVKHKWLKMDGSDNRVDHCYFSGKTDKDVIVKVIVDSNPDYHRFDHNYFGNRPYPPGGGNGFEIFRIGNGSVSTFESGTVLEHNYFYRCSGETEIVSNKSCDNVYRHNTFVECEGTLTIRQGKRVLVDGNFFFGNGKNKTGGVRIIGEDHTVINNYFADLAGNGSRSGLSMMTGIPGLTAGGHAQTVNALVAFNTFVNCSQTMNIGLYDDDDDPVLSLPPEGCTIANNIIKGSTSPLITQNEQFGEPNVIWQGNIFHGADLGIDPNPGIAEIDPLLEPDAGGLYRPSAASPAVDASAGDYPMVTTDMDGQERNDAARDVGADELSPQPTTAGPLKPEDVGPNWWQWP